ncbi:MAG: CoA transferase [Pseudorhodobacter sp.]|nr:CoA transferase [Pseudorhodobacter sp.]
MKPLAGLRVLDLTRVLAGPFCTALLADLGAEIIKLEPPAGDDYRHIGPFVAGESALFTLVNRGKDSIVIDLKAPEGQALAAAIAAQCDVVVENFRPGVAARLGLGAETLRAANPALIYASISGFGQTGPNTALPAYDLVAQAMSGLMAVTGEDGGEPLKVGESYGDLMAGLYASWAILAALYQRHATGTGATIDVAMFDALFSLLPTSHALQFYAKTAPRRTGNRHPLSTPFGCFPCADGQAVIAVLGAAQWTHLCTLIGIDARNPNYLTDELRTLHEPEIKAAIEVWTRTQATAAVVATLTAAGIPTARVQTLAEAIASPQAQARELVSALPHHHLGHAATVGQPVFFDGEKPISATSAPALGGQTDAILTRLGLGAAIAPLRAAGIIAGNPHD